MPEKGNNLRVRKDRLMGELWRLNIVCNSIGRGGVSKLVTADVCNVPVKYTGPGYFLLHPIRQWDEEKTIEYVTKHNLLNWVYNNNKLEWKVIMMLTIKFT